MQGDSDNTCPIDSKHLKMTQIIVNGLVRGCDTGGCGYFGASRKRLVNGVWKSVKGAHKGIDVNGNVGQSVYAPFPCRVVKFGKPYLNDSRYDLVEIEGIEEWEGFKAKLMYVAPSFHSPIGTIIRNESREIGTLQNIQEKHPSVPPHTHFELYRHGKLVNPECYLINGKFKLDYAI